MSKDKVFIVLSHKNSLKKGSRTDWEVTETVEFVNCLRNKHTTLSTVIIDYINREIIKGKSAGITDYQKVEDYVRSKYGPQMKILDKQYRPENLSVDTKGDTLTVVADQSGNLHAEAIMVSDD